MAVHPFLQAHLQKKCGASGFSTSGDSFTIGAVSMDHRSLQELLDIALVNKHDVKVVGGAVQIIPR